MSRIGGATVGMIRRLKSASNMRAHGNLRAAIAAGAHPVFGAMHGDDLPNTL